MHFNFFHDRLEREHRMLHFAGGIDNVPDLMEKEENQFRSWKDETPGAEHLLNAFASSRKITVEDLRNYLTTVERQEQIHQEIKQRLSLLDDVNATVHHRSTAELQLQRLCDFIVQRNRFTNEAKDRLRNLQLTSPELPSSIAYARDKVGGVLTATIDGFNEASGQEKAVMLAGVVAAFLFLRNIINSGGKTKLGKFVGNMFKLAAGGFLSIMALQAVNKAVERSSGRPLIDSRHLGFGGTDSGLPSFPYFRYNQKEWEEKRYNDVVDAAIDELQHGPRAVLEDIYLKQGIDDPAKAMAKGISAQEFKRRRRGNIAGIVNISTIGVDQLTELYKATKDKKAIEQDDVHYPRRPFKKDGLTAAERFEVVKHIGTTVKLIDAAGELLPVEPNREDKKLLYLMLDI